MLTKTENQVFISLHLQASQFCNIFTTHVVFFYSFIKDLLLTVLVYMQQQ